MSPIPTFTAEYLQYHQIPITWFGFIYFLLNLASYLGVKLYDLVKCNTKDFSLLAVALGVFGIAIAFAGVLTNRYLSIVAFFLARVLIGFIWNTLKIITNEVSNNENRATIISLKTLVLDFAFVITDPLTGYLILLNNILFVYLIIGIISIVIAILASAVFRKKTA